MVWGIRTRGIFLGLHFGGGWGVSLMRGELAGWPRVINGPGACAGEVCPVLIVICVVGLALGAGEEEPRRVRIDWPEGKGGAGGG